MKKILLFVAVLFAVLAGNAQVYLFQESFEASGIPEGWVTLDDDGDGYNWYVLYGQGEHPEDMAHTGIGHATSASYYGEEALTPDNWLITKEIEIPADANQPTLSWWAKGQDPSWAAEHYAVYISTTGQTVADFTTQVYDGDATGEYVMHTVNLSDYAGQTIYVAFRHYDITDMFRLNIDDIAVYTAPDEASLTVDPTSIDFGSVLVGETATKTATVMAFNLTEGIVINAEEPFTVSNDGITYGAACSISDAGGIFYVQFTPTSTDAVEGTVTLTSGELTATIALAGSGYSCLIDNFPYTTSFSEDDVTLSCWSILDANGDGTSSNGKLFLGENAILYVYSTTNAADDWLYSPEIKGTNLSASIDYKVEMSSYPETFGVYVITEDDVAHEVVAPMTVDNTTYETLPIDLSAYDNQTIRVGFHVTSEADKYYLYLTNFTVNGDAATTTNTYEITATANPAEGGTIEGANTYEEGATATLIATANTGYTFTNWTKDGDTVSTEATYTFTVTEDAAFVANFTADGDTTPVNTYTITATANPAEGGTIEGADTYEEGATATLIATANTGYTFTCWTKDGDTVSTEATYTFTVTEDAAFVANFEITDGIYEVSASNTNVNIYNYDNQIVVKNAEGLSVAIYDINGRLIVNESKVSQSECRYTVSTSGIYLVRVGESVVKKVAILNR